MENLPTDILYKMFGEMSPRELNALRSTCKTMRDAVDNYMWHKCAIIRHRNDACSKVLDIIIKAMKFIVGKQRDLIPIFMLNIIITEFEKFNSHFIFAVFRVLRHKIWSNLIRKDNEISQDMICDSSESIQITKKRTQFICYHITVFKIINELLRSEYTSCKLHTDDSGILFEKDFERCSDIPFIFDILFFLFSELNSENTEKVRTFSQTSKIIVKLIGPLKNTKKKDVEFIYHFESHEYDGIRKTDYKCKFNPSDARFETIPFLYS
ncbi:uncharacterized protein LOC119685773 [Teleopsis dalmanni]|uniref:uncharacterized protein LOC119685773 n=1 Tax=Teleopsis dalmanni TaxID=139649 RepID=UPI0018CCD17C|nr:uncharacterized protein LOC119685773 [Teleopsis dalmanni]